MIATLSDYDLFLEEIGVTSEEMRNQAPKVPFIPIPSAYMWNVYIGPSEIEGKGTFAYHEIGPGEMISPAKMGLEWTSLGRYANHASNANAFMQKKGDVLMCVALRTIHSGQEITVNYRQVKQSMEDLH